MSEIDEPRGNAGASLSSKAQAGLAEERSIAAQEAELAALKRITDDNVPGTAEGVEAILEGASPDDANRLRVALGLPKPEGSARISRDELKDDWRAGGHPYSIV